MRLRVASSRDFENMVRAQYLCDTGWHHWRARDLEPVWEVAGCKVCASVKVNWSSEIAGACREIMIISGDVFIPVMCNW